MSKPLWGTLQSLQDAARDHVFSREVFQNAPDVTFGADGVCRGSTEQERLAVDTAILEGVKLLARERPRHSERAMREFMRRVQKNAEAGTELVCGFGFIVTVLISWLIGQALSFLWRQWMRQDEMPALICDMAGAGS